MTLTVLRSPRQGFCPTSPSLILSDFFFGMGLRLWIWGEEYQRGEVPFLSCRLFSLDALSVSGGGSGDPNVQHNLYDDKL